MIALNDHKRDIFGKKLHAKREAGLLPVVVYGAGEQAHSLFVDAKDFMKVWKMAGESSVVSLNTPEGKKDVLIQEVSLHSVSDQPIHADFYMVRADQLIKVNVPLRFEGTAPAAKTFGGVLVKVMHEIEVEALPANLPHEVTVDVSGIVNLEDQVTVKDLKLPAGVKVEAHADDVVALVSVGKEESEEPAIPVDLSKIEVEKKGKKPEEGEAEASAAASTPKK